MHIYLLQAQVEAIKVNVKKSGANNRPSIDSLMSGVQLDGRCRARSKDNEAESQFRKSKQPSDSQGHSTAQLQFWLTIAAIAEDWRVM